MSLPNSSREERFSEKQQSSTRVDGGDVLLGTKGARSRRPETEDDTDEGYDRAAHGGSLEEDEDAYDQLTRVDGVDLEAGVVDTLDPANLSAALEEPTEESPEGELLSTSALDVDALEQHNDVELELPTDAFSDNALDEEDDGGSISPEELGEQFLRDAVQQERRGARNDRESHDNVELLSEAIHDVSLFDHNLDPLGEPRFPKVVADETEADASHHPGDRRAAKRAAARQAEEAVGDGGATNASPKVASRNSSASSEAAASSKSNTSPKKAKTAKPGAGRNSRA